MTTTLPYMPRSQSLRVGVMNFSTSTLGIQTVKLFSESSSSIYSSHWTFHAFSLWPALSCFKVEKGLIFSQMPPNSHYPEIESLLNDR